MEENDSRQNLSKVQYYVVGTQTWMTKAGRGFAKAAFGNREGRRQQSYNSVGITVVTAVYGAPPLYITGAMRVPLPELSLIFTTHAGLVLTHFIGEETKSEQG